MQAGLDSLAAVDLRNAVAAAFAVELPATAAFDYPTAAALAACVVEETQGGTPQPTAGCLAGGDERGGGAGDAPAGGAAAAAAAVQEVLAGVREAVEAAVGASVPDDGALMEVSSRSFHLGPVSGCKQTIRLFKHICRSRCRHIAHVLHHR